MAAGPDGEVIAGLVVAVLPGAALALEEGVVGGVVDAGDVATPGSGVPLLVVGAGDPGGDVARGGGQGGSRYSASNCRSCDRPRPGCLPGSPA